MNNERITANQHRRHGGPQMQNRPLDRIGVGSPVCRRWPLLGLLPMLILCSLLSAAQPDGDPRRTALDEFQAVPPFVVRVDADRPDRVYHGGDTIRLSVRSERDGYLYLFYCDTSRSVSCLFPNQAQQDNSISAGQTLIIPSESASFQLRVGPPYGREVLKAIVTTAPLRSLEIQALTKGDLTPIGTKRFKGVFVELRGAPGDSTAGTPTVSPQRSWSEHDLELTTVEPNSPAPSRPSLAEVTRREEGRPAIVTGRPESPGSATVDSGGARIGVFIGISKYRDPQIRPLTTADDDARAIAAALQSRGQLSESVMLIDEQATLANIRRLIQEALPAVTRPGDTIILYWSGHGGRVSNVDGNEPDGFDEYLVPFDGRLEPATAVRNTMLIDKSFGRWVQNLDGRRLVVILDACHSGGQTQGARKTLSRSRTHVPFRDFFFKTTLRRIKDIGQRETAVLASSRATQLSFERRDGSLSVMTHFLVERIKNGAEPLLLPDAAGYVIERVPEFVEKHYGGTTQTPVFVDYTTQPVYLRP